MKRTLISCLAAAAWLVSGQAAHSVPLVFNASGVAAADIQGQVDAFRLALGGGSPNPNVPGSFGTGRREINWDAVPEANSSPNPFPADFFNQAVPGRARGAVFSTPGTGFQVSANAGNPAAAIQFGNINPSYPAIFETFSPQKLFTALGSTITDVNFFVPGSSTPALTNAFGAVFTDVNDSTSTSIEFFDASNNLIRKDFVPAIAGDETFSFLGAVFDDPNQFVSRVRITSGDTALGPNEALGLDLVVMDDFIYGEPIAAAVAVPEPGSLALIGSGILALFWFRRRSSQV